MSHSYYPQSFLTLDYLYQGFFTLVIMKHHIGSFINTPTSSSACVKKILHPNSTLPTKRGTAMRGRHSGSSLLSSLGRWKLTGVVEIKLRSGRPRQYSETAASWIARKAKHRFVWGRFHRKKRRIHEKKTSSTSQRCTGRALGFCCSQRNREHFTGRGKNRFN